ncbi:MAG: DUF1599 domain-containing protein [Flavobacteriales bacterium]
MAETLAQYDTIVTQCRDLFIKKMKDYGCSWRVLRMPSLTDQIFIKAQRIRTLQRTGTSKVDEGLEPEFKAMINYSAMALIQQELGIADQPDLDEKKAIELYDRHMHATRDLMTKKNHDYGEAWRDMRVASLTDLILVKILRIKQIEENHGKTQVSEGVEGNYADILNYSVFALILLENG